MKKYQLSIPFSGYSRGYVIQSVEANSVEEAIEKADHWDVDHEETVRDDREFRYEDISVEEME